MGHGAWGIGIADCRFEIADFKIWEFRGKIIFL
jgi:hypothetical protein